MRKAVPTITYISNGKLIKQKRCTMCNIIKTLESGYYFNERINRHQSRCKKCTKKVAAEVEMEKLNKLSKEEKRKFFNDLRMKYDRRYKNRGQEIAVET